MISDNIILKAFRIHKNLSIEPIREILYFRYLPKLYFGCTIILEFHEIII